MLNEDGIEVHPVQTRKPFKGARVSSVVALRAYKVYSNIHGKQEALITGECRGGFSAGELIAFLYAHTFPEKEWRTRASEAFNGMREL